MATSTISFGAPVEQDRFSRYFGIAVATHAVLFVGMMLMPSGWLTPADEPERKVFYISLGGSVGEKTSGLQQIASRPVQQATPEPVRPQYQAPAEKAPEMALPTRTPVKVAPQPETKTPIQSTAEKPASRTPIRGAEVRAGTARVDTQAITDGQGLSAGGGGGTGGETNLADFCCPQYIEAMLAAIRRTWKRNQGMDGLAMVRFTIQRDGRITDVSVPTPGVFLLDREAQVAVMNAKLSQLPQQFTEPRLVVRLKFEYKR
ncbi:MAG: TonB family protein [Acidobacteriota bacterium]|nr:TonB family protein [Acidobacteriota bacterium]